MNYLATSDRFFGDESGGGYRIAWELAKAIRDEGHEVSLLCGSLPQDGPIGPSWIDNICVIRYRFPETFSLNPARQLLHIHAAKKAAYRWLADRQWDVIHSHMLYSGLAAFAVLGQRSLRISTVHSSAVLEQRINWSNQGFAGRVKLLAGQKLISRAEFRLFSIADRLHVLSDFTRQTVTSLYGGGIAAKIQKVPWWQDPRSTRLSKEEARRKLGWPLHEAVFLTLRRMVPRMGLDVFLSALENLAEKHNFTAVLAGDGPERARLMQRISTGRLTSRVLFPGRMPESELPLAYQAADAFVLPTIALEGFGIIILEAWANGCPVIASNIGAISELLQPISPQCLVEPANAQALNEILERVLTGSLKLPRPEELMNHVAGRYSRHILLPEYLRLLTAPIDTSETPDTGLLI